MSLDQLDQIAAAADSSLGAIDNPGQPLGEGAQVQQGPDYRTAAAGMVEMFAAMACGYAPEAGPIWTPDAKARTAEALAPVLEKYSIDLGAMPPEITLLIVAGPLLWQTAKIIGMKNQAARAKAKIDTSGASDAAITPGPGETFGEHDGNG